MAINVPKSPKFKSPKVPYAAAPILMRQREEHTREIFGE